MSWFIAYAAAGWVIRLGMIPVILGRQFPPGTSLAWLCIVFLHPYVGGLLYLLLGENRLGSRYARPKQAMPIDLKGSAIQMQVERVGGMPPTRADSMELIDDAAAMVQRLVADIDEARREVHLLYFILAPDETGRRVCGALSRAAARGVKCRLLVDGVGSRPLLRDECDLEKLRQAGVKVAVALPVHPVRRLLARMDYRNHRKLAVMDGQVALVGSHNLINPDYGGRKGAPWYDLTARLTGPVVGQLGAVFQKDWAIETGQRLEMPTSADYPPVEAGMSAQVAPTGPRSGSESYRRVLLAAVQSAQERLTLTSPYFVPDEPTLVALQMAAERQVDVNLILPKTPDHALTAIAGRSHFEQLLSAGVKIHLYRPGLVHAKTVTVDDELAIIGSANLDLRSFNLNFELSVVLYGPQATQQVLLIQEKYRSQSDSLELLQWQARSAVRRYSERAVALLSPLL